jgi:hypothetical protein
VLCTLTDGARNKNRHVLTRRADSERERDRHADLDTLRSAVDHVPKHPHTFLKLD